MAFATDDDVSDALGRSLTSSEATVVDSLLEQASDLIIGYGIPYDIDPVPGAVTRVAASMVVAVFTKPSINIADYDATGYRTTSETASVRVGMESATTTGPWLTNALKMRLNPYRSKGMNQIGMRSESDMVKDVWPQLSEVYPDNLI